MLTHKPELKEGDRIRVGAIHAEMYNYERIVGKEVIVKKTSEASNHTRVHVKHEMGGGKESKWFILLEDAHPIEAINTNYRHLLSEEGDY